MNRNSLMVPEGFKSSLILLDKIDQMINDDEEEDYNKLFNNFQSEKSSENAQPKFEEEFKLDNDDLFLSELGNIILNDDGNSVENYDDLQDDSFDDIQKIMASCEKEQKRMTLGRSRVISTFANQDQEDLRIEMDESPLYNR